MVLDQSLKRVWTELDDLPQTEADARGNCPWSLGWTENTVAGSPRHTYQRPWQWLAVLPGNQVGSGTEPKVAVRKGKEVGSCCSG